MGDLNDAMSSLKRGLGRLLLIVLTLWALAMIVPDLYRLARPLGSFGLSVNGDGLITDVKWPFHEEAASPAWQAGLRPGDRLDLAQMRCIPVNTLRCATSLAVLSELKLVGPERRGELVVTATAEKPARQIELVARTRPFSWWVAVTVPLDLLAGISVILAAAWLVWTRPGGMTWGFFLYVIWFNPGQAQLFYAFLQYFPAALLTQYLAGAVAQGAGLAGFLLFALRAPNDSSTPRWRPVERALPFVAFGLAVLLALTNANVFGFPGELLMRAGAASGIAVAAGALALLLARRAEQTPLDYQRLRWVIWGCLIGLPSLSLADFGQQTTLISNVLGPVPDGLWDLVRLINGVLCLFVFEAVRRPVVVNVEIPLRRVTILGLLLSAPALFLHEQFQHVSEGAQEHLTLPTWVWLAIATFAVFIISRLHESATHHANYFFNRSVVKAGREIGKAVLQAADFATIEEQLVKDVCQKFKLASAAVFRHEGGVYRRSLCAAGWDDAIGKALKLDDETLTRLQARHSLDLSADDVKGGDVPGGLARPVFATAIGDRFEHHAIALYGPHESGANLNEDERAKLTELAKLAGEVWTKLDHEQLRRRVETLQTALAAYRP